jgi:hypothetical protein
MFGGNHATNTFYGGGGNDVMIGGDHSTNTFYDSTGNDTYIGGNGGDNFFIFDNIKYPLGSLGDTPTALADQSAASGTFQFISAGADEVHGNPGSTHNVVELKGAPGSWSINVTDPAFGVHEVTDGSWTALAGHTLQGTITSSANGEAVSFDHINEVKFIS